MRFRYAFALLASMACATASPAVTVFVSTGGSFADDVRTLSAGVYTVRLLSGAINTVSTGMPGHGCNSSGENCSEGYYSRFTVWLPGQPLLYNTAEREAFATKSQSFDFYSAFPALSFSLAAQSEVTFAVARDQGHLDRVGSLQLDLEQVDAPRAVPEPATWAMFIGGFGLMGGVMRGRRRTSVRFV